MPKILEFDENARRALERGVDKLADTVKAHVLKADGFYDRVDKRGKELIDSQRVFCDEAVKEAQEALHPRGERVFIPAEAKEN